jgi:hypothetical protein
MTTDPTVASPRVPDEPPPATGHRTGQDTTHPVETDPGRLTTRLRPTRDHPRLHPARVLNTGPAFRQNPRHDHNEPDLNADPQNRLPATFTELTLASDQGIHRGSVCSHSANATPPTRLDTSNFTL